MFYKCIESCLYQGVKYTKSIVYPFAVAPTGDGAAYFELFAGEIKKPVNFLTQKGLRGTMYMGAVGWNDLRFAAQNVFVNPITSKPDFDYDEVEFLFDDAATETVVGVGQMDHDWKEGSRLYPHIHWIQEAAGVVKWQLEYKFWNSGDLVPDWTTITTVEAAFAYASGALGQVSAFPSIDGADLSLSFNIKFKLSRLGGDGADTMVGDARFTEFDFHYRKDSWGSGELHIK